MGLEGITPPTEDEESEKKEKPTFDQKSVMAAMQGLSPKGEDAMTKPEGDPEGKPKAQSEEQKPKQAQPQIDEEE